MHYFAKVIKENGVFLVSFPEVPGAITEGDTFEDALKYASEALNGCLEADFERGFKLPAPKEYNDKNFHPIRVLPHLEVAFNLRILRKNDSQKVIAKRLGISYQAYQKLENPRKCNPTVKTLEKIGAIFGKSLQVSFR